MCGPANEVDASGSIIIEPRLLLLESEPVRECEWDGREEDEAVEERDEWREW